MLEYPHPEELLPCAGGEGGSLEFDLAAPCTHLMIAIERGTAGTLTVDWG